MPSDAEEQFDPAPVLAAFTQGGVDYVVIGGVAGGAHGSAYGTFDVDLAYSRERENLERIASVLRSLDAKLRGAPPDVPFQLDADALEEGGNFAFITRLGSVDILAYPAGAPPYERLRDEALVIEVQGMPGERKTSSMPASTACSLTNCAHLATTPTVRLPSP